MGSTSIFVSIFLFALLNCPPLPFSLPLPLPRPPHHNFRRLNLTAGIGPESIAFDPNGEGPYTGISDGRIVKWDLTKNEWIEFATTSNNRNKEECDGNQDPQLEDMCGRPLGLQFNKATGYLWIADAYYGLMTVGPSGGLATLLADGVEDEPFCFTNALDINPNNGLVYFTDSSSRFPRRDYMQVIDSGDNSGRLMEYNPKTKQVRVLLRGLQFPNGVALSEDATFLLVGESTTSRILRFWLQGPRAGTYQIFKDLFPWTVDNIRRNSAGDFWVATPHLPETKTRVLARSLMSFVKDPQDFVVGIKINCGRDVLQVLHSSEYGIIEAPASEVQENNGTLYIGSIFPPFVGVIEDLCMEKCYGF